MHPLYCTAEENQPHSDDDIKHETTRTKQHVRRRTHIKKCQSELLQFLRFGVGTWRRRHRRKFKTSSSPVETCLLEHFAAESPVKPLSAPGPGNEKTRIIRLLVASLVDLAASPGIATHVKKGF